MICESTCACACLVACFPPVPVAFSRTHAVLRGFPSLHSHTFMTAGTSRIVFSAEPIKLDIRFACHGVCGGRLKTGRPCVVSLSDPSGAWKELRNVLMCAGCVRALKQGLAVDDVAQGSPRRVAPLEAICPTATPSSIRWRTGCSTIPRRRSPGPTCTVPIKRTAAQWIQLFSLPKTAAPRCNARLAVNGAPRGWYPLIFFYARRWAGKKNQRSRVSDAFTPGWSPPVVSAS